MNKLNQRNTAFCLNVLAGQIQYKAYQDAGYDVSDEVAMANSSELLRNPKIIERLEELRKPVYDEMIVSLREREEILSKIIRQEVDFESVSNDKILEANLRATHLLNKQQKVYSDAPQVDRREYHLHLMSGSKEAETAIKHIMGGDTAKED